jgi:hypothetical protein
LTTTQRFCVYSKEVKGDGLCKPANFQAKDSRCIRHRKE